MNIGLNEKYNHEGRNEMENYRFRINGTMVEISATSYIEALTLADALQDDDGEQTWTDAAEVVAAWRID